MKRLQIEEIRKANTELEELTDIFVRWGNDLNDGQQAVETLSAFELGSITNNSTSYGDFLNEQNYNIFIYMLLL